VEGSAADSDTVCYQLQIQQNANRKALPQCTIIDCRCGISSSPIPITALSAIRVVKVWVLSGASDLGVGVRYVITFCGMCFEHKL